MKRRKTIDVEKVRARVNRALNNENALQAQEDNYGASRAVAYRQGLYAVLEDVLESTGNYQGFQFTDGDNGRTDNSRREYY